MHDEPNERPGWLEARVIDRTSWAPGLITLKLDVTPSFEAGQFFNLGLTIQGAFDRRAYSAASAPEAPLEFFIAEVQEGEFSPALFELDRGSTVWVERKPQGFFTLRYVPEARDLWLVCTGTGLGPFIAMLREGTVWRRFERVVVVHGVRDGSQFAYRDELARYSEERDLTLVTCVSRASAAPPQVAGRLTQALQSGALERAAGLELTPEQSHVMLCGNPDMISEAMALLQTRGLARHRQRKPGHITTEKYW